MARRQPEVHIRPDGTAIIPLTRGLVTIVDRQDADLGAMLWHAQPSRGEHICAARNVYNSGGRKKEYLHRVILARMLGRALRPGEQVDHIDGNPLNNRRSNLRPATHTQNRRNNRVYMTNDSGYKGVYWINQRRKWRALIRHNDRLQHLGMYTSRIDAARAYDEAARELHGEFARVNFPRDGEQSARRNHNGMNG